MSEARSYITISTYPRGEYSFDPLEEKPDIPDAMAIEDDPDEPVYYVVQFQESLTEEQKAQLRQTYQLRLNEYIPTNAFVERLRPEQLRALSQEPMFRASVVYQPAFKISPTIGQVEFRTPERREVEGLWLEAVLSEETDPYQAANLLGGANASHIRVLDDRQFGGRLRVRFVVAGEEGLLDIARLKEVRWIEEVPEQIDDNGTTAGTIQSGTPGSEPIWDQGIHGEGQIIGVIDRTRVDINHCWFEDPTNNTPGANHRKVVGLRGDAEPAVNPNGHSTFVCGIAVGDDFNNPGADANLGMAWAARITSDSRPDRGTNQGITMLALLTRAAADGAFIHTNSWHDNTAGALMPATYNQTAADVDFFTWNNEDHLVTGSSGNVRMNPAGTIIGEEQGPPGTAKNAICVSATRRDPAEMSFGDGNPGPTADGRRKPDLFAPGCNITSADHGSGCLTATRGCASSWATPAVAGAAALVRQYYTEGWYPTTDGKPRAECGFAPSGALLKATLLNSTIDMTRLRDYPGSANGTDPRLDRLEGWGLIRLNNTLSFSGSDRDLRVWDTRNARGLRTGETRTHQVNVASNKQALKITLVWTEPPRAAGSTAPVVNNLNLVAISPDGSQTFLGNRFVGGASAQGGTADLTNNVEMVLINNPAPGDWTIQVTGTQVNFGNPGQGYALVISADLTPTSSIRVSDSVGFGNVAVGDFRSRPLRIRNLGTVDVTVTFPTQPPPPPFPTFRWDHQGSFVIEPCSLTTVSVEFNPKGVGQIEETLTITSNTPGSPHEIRLHGRGIDVRIP